MGFLIKKYMDEAKRIFRYILPGLAFAIPTLIAAYLAKGEELISWVRTDSGSAVLQFVGFFILSGGVGYIFSIVYYACFWRQMDHLQMVQSSIQSKTLSVFRFDGKPVNADDITYSEAWYVVQVVWHSLAVENGPIKHIENRGLPGLLSDILSGSATTAVALFFSVVVTLFSIACTADRVCYPWVVVLLLIELGLCLASFRNYQVTWNRWNAEINSALATSLSKRYDDKVKPMQVVIEIE